MDSASPQNNQPVIDPTHELPAPPVEKELPAPHDMLLTPHITHHHPWLHWMPAIIGLFIGMVVGGVFIGGTQNNRDYMNQNFPVSATMTPVPITPEIPAAVENIPSPTQTIPITNGIYCTQEAKQCPDGSWVGRAGPNCEFLPCTTQQP